MSELTRIPAPDGVAPAAQYSHVVLGRGRFVAVSGQVFEDLRRCLAAAGATFDEVLKLTYFVTDMAHLPAIRAARAAHIPYARLPAGDRGVRRGGRVNRRPQQARGA
ncbi:RidA family protein [Streptomyces sviceus]|uniref:RidA family protein n=1 Tax=Streptomyces sviceus TaxID=285530 RepID=UPI00367E75CA